MEMSVESATMRYGDLNGNIQLVELQKGQTGLGLSLAGNRDRNKMSVFVCGLHPKGSAYRDGRIRVGDEILEVNGYALFGRCHLNASAVIKSLDGPVYRILLLRRESALNEMAVKPLTQFPVHLEEEALEEKYNRFTGVRTVTVRKSPLGLGIMIIEGKHTDLGRGVFISDIQSGSPAEQSGLAVGDMILCVNQTDLICSDYDTAASLLKNAEGLLSIVVAKPNKTCLKTSLSHGPDNSLRRLSSPSNNCSPNNNNLKMEGGVTAPSSQSCKQKSDHDLHTHQSCLHDETRGKGQPDAYDGKSSGLSAAPSVRSCGGILTRASSTVSRPSVESISSSPNTSTRCSSRCSSREIGERQVDQRTASKKTVVLSVHTEPTDFSSNFSPQLLPPFVPNTRRGSKDELDTKSCPIIPARETLIEISKKSLGLGLNVVGGADTPLGVLMIQDILPNGSAAADGRLKIGDVILRVNDRDLRPLSHRQAISALREAPSVIQLLVFRENEHVNEQSDLYEVIATEMIKKAGRGLGMVISEGAGSGIIVSEVIRGGVSDSNGRIAEGDRILEVNGRDMKIVSHEEATNILKILTGKIEMKIQRMRISPSTRSKLTSNRISD